MATGVPLRALLGDGAAHRPGWSAATTAPGCRCRTRPRSPWTVPRCAGSARRQARACWPRCRPTGAAVRRPETARIRHAPGRRVGLRVRPVPQPGPPPIALPALAELAPPPGTALTRADLERWSRLVIGRGRAGSHPGTAIRSLRPAARCGCSRPRSTGTAAASARRPSASRSCRCRTACPPAKRTESTMKLGVTGSPAPATACAPSCCPS